MTYKRDMSPVSPLRHFPLFQTRDPEVAYNSFSPLGVTEYEVTTAASAYDAQVNRVVLRDMAITHNFSSAGIRLKFSTKDVMYQRVCLTGSARSTAANINTDLNPHQWSALVPAGEGSCLNLEPDYEELRMAVTETLLRRKLGSLLGDSPVDHLAFSPNTDVASSGMLRYRRLLTFLLSELEIGGPRALGVVVDEIAEALLISYLHAHQHNFSHRLTIFPCAPSLSQLRRAEDFIAANWGAALSIEDITKATDLSARSIFRSFKDNHGCSPFEYIKRLRLQHAHAMLVAPRSDMTVTGVAFKCGFHSLGHFARSYQAVFGELPSETLRQSNK